MPTSIGELISKANIAQAMASAHASADLRDYRVSVAYTVFAEVVIRSESGASARAVAMQNPRSLKRKFRTEPFFYRTEVCSLDAAGNKVWREVDCPGESNG